MNLTFKPYIREPIDLTIENDFITDISDDNLDADLICEYLAAWDDPVVYGMSRVGWSVLQF